MERIAQGALSILTYAAIAGIIEMLLPEGRLRQAAEALLGLMAARLLIETAIGLFSA